MVPLKSVILTHLQFTLCKIPLVAMGIHYCIISFNGDCSQSDYCRSWPSPRDDSTCHGFAQLYSKHLVRVVSEREFVENSRGYEHCVDDIRYSQVYEQIIHGIPLELKVLYKQGQRQKYERGRM